MPLTGTVNKSIEIDLSKKSDISGKKILIVGGTSGLGRAISLNAASRGAIVKVVGRSFKDEGINGISFEGADLSLMKEAKRIGEIVDDDFDVVVFTQGIIAGTKRAESEERIELDMAVSYLSRLVILKSLIPRLKAGARIFIMGFPGSAPSSYRIDDLNAEKEYVGKFGFVHANTVVGNEALVIHWAATDKDHSFFGLNPGLIKTGIRQGAYDTVGMKMMAPVLEGMLGLFGPKPDSYGKIMTDLISVEGLEEHSGNSFNPKGQPILVLPCFRQTLNWPRSSWRGVKNLSKRRLEFRPTVESYELFLQNVLLNCLVWSSSKEKWKKMLKNDKWKVLLHQSFTCM
jgi:NAD(P)-dependent dehydrogenase (short-subunit alcohol dehydrogenase family)